MNDQPFLKMMGDVSASASHDILNVLAILNEHTGLLSDLLALKGEVTPDQLLQTTHAMESQIKRGKDLLEHLNRFAHSPDTLNSPARLQPIDVAETITEIARLTHRRFHIEIISPLPPLPLSCEPMLLRLFIYTLFKEAADHDASPRITMSAGKGRLQTQTPFYPSPRLLEYASHLGIGLSPENGLHLALP